MGFKSGTGDDSALNLNIEKIITLVKKFCCYNFSCIFLPTFTLLFHPIFVCMSILLTVLHLIELTILRVVSFVLLDSSLGR